MAFGQAMGVNEAVTPPFPNSDHWYVGNSYVIHLLCPLFVSRSRMLPMISRLMNRLQHRSEWMYWYSTRPRPESRERRQLRRRRKPESKNSIALKILLC